MGSKTVAWTSCPCGKRGFEDEHDAQKALGRARTKRERNFEGGGSRRGMYRENRYYWCPYGDLYHLTEQSRRSFDGVTAFVPSQRPSPDLVSA